MSASSGVVARCQYIKADHTRCASPALRRRKFCYFHKQWRQEQLEMSANIRRERKHLTLPALGNAESLQKGKIKVMRLLAMQRTDRRTASLILFALRTASSNLTRNSPPT